MKTLFTALVATIALGVAPAYAQSDAQHILEAVFQSFDENHDGVITSDEANRFIEKTFAEMDVKHTGRISRDAWMRFSFGLADLAADQGRSDAYDVAKYEIFKRWNGGKADGLSLEDYRAGVLDDARKGVGANTVQGLKIDYAAFQRAPFVRQIMSALR
jgi:hypothetical protein